MAYLAPTEFVTKMVDACESKIYMSTRDTLIRAFMAWAILALAAVFAVTITLMECKCQKPALVLRKLGSNINLCLTIIARFLNGLMNL